MAEPYEFHVNKRSQMIKQRIVKRGEWPHTTSVREHSQWTTLSRTEQRTAKHNEIWFTDMTHYLAVLFYETK